MSGDLLRVVEVSKAYAGVQALSGVSMSIGSGEIHCLVGENGSGKSTLIKAIAGVIPVDSGRIMLGGRHYRHLHAIDAIREGVQVIYQDLSLFPNMSIAENISLNTLVERGRKFVNWQEVRKVAAEELAKIGVPLDVEAPVEGLSMANRQIVAITRALTQKARLIIMDEPTAALTQAEIDALFAVILDLKAKGISTLFVSHKLSEVFQISDKVTVLRDGQRIGEFATKELDAETLVFHMTGEKLDSSLFARKAENAETLLELQGLSKRGNYEEVSLALHAGEILGITGLLGSGRTELALSLFGLNKPDSGRILFRGREVRIRSPRQASRLGIGFLPEDRHNQGLFLEQAIGKNIVSTVLGRLRSALGLISEDKKKSTVEAWMGRLKIKASSPEIPAGSLSGGNQQRTVLAKWLATSPKVFILDSPTVGIDIKSKGEIHGIIRSLAGQGIGVIMISDEVQEVHRNCSRILIMSCGRIVADLDPASVTEAQILEQMGRSRENRETEART